MSSVIDRALIAAVLASVMLTGAAPVAVARGEGCPARLVSIPLETIVPPVGLEWTSLGVGAVGGLPLWTGTMASTDPAEFLLAVVTLGCSFDASLMLARNEAAQEVVGSTKLEMTIIGDGSYAYRTELDQVTIMWAHGDLIGTIVGNHDDLESLEGLAQAIDAVVPQ